MRQVHVDVVLANKLLTAKEVRPVVRALEKQVKRDFAPIWDVTAELDLVTDPRKSHPGAWQLLLLDELEGTDDGYHQLTREGLPLGRVLLRTAMKDPTSWPSTASHELLEMLVNPDGQRAVFLYDDDVGGRIYAYEVCDACQDDPLCYRVEGVWMSDFVYPEWFETWRKPRSARFDHNRKLTRPLQIAKNGYAAFYDARARKWISDWGTHLAKGLRPADGYAIRGGSRRALREIPRTKWKRSTR